MHFHWHCCLEMVTGAQATNNKVSTSLIRRFIIFGAIFSIYFITVIVSIYRLVA
jgi:uncharacterized membrane protein